MLLIRHPKPRNRVSNSPTLRTVRVQNSVSALYLSQSRIFGETVPALKVMGSPRLQSWEVHETIVDVDMNARYLFIIGSDIPLQTTLKKEFPNAEFASKTIHLTHTKYDMVIALTSCIDHKYYLAIKKQCKDHDIPFVHCPHSNIEMMRTVIFNFWNN